jgi:16S rRNA (cytosine967-C5)-methyltransferase
LERDSLDRRFAQELASGCVRLRARLDHALQAHCARALHSLQPDVLDVLRLGAYQLLEVDRVGAWSAVDTSVELAKHVAPRAAGLVNAVLRALDHDADEIAYPEPRAQPLAYATSAGSHPEWIAARWLERFGGDEMLRLCAYNNARPDTCLRVSARHSREELVAQLKDAAPTRWSRVGVRVRAGHYQQVRRWVDAGVVSVQDESGMLVGVEAAPGQGETWLDLAAAPGGKTSHLSEQVGEAGQVFAYDRSAAKVQRVRDNASRLGLRNVVAAEGDARCLRPPRADGVLLDAPCSGLGVLSRRPDARWRKRAADLTRLSALQSELLRAAAGHVRRGGVLVYSVCSFEPEETSAVVEEFQCRHADFVLESGNAPAALRESPGILYFLPQRHAVDGGFVARWRRQE